MTWASDAGWFICYSGSELQRKTWHYFDEQQLRARCGVARFNTRLLAGVEVQTTEQTIVSRMEAPFCGRCDRTRRREEGR